MYSNSRIVVAQCRAFSFIEVMFVILIIGLLAGAVAMKVGGYMDKAKLNRAKSDIAVMINAIESHYAESGQYPSNDEGLGILPIKNTNDPWGRPYQYNHPGRSEPYEVICYGADGREGGDGANSDITSEMLE